MELFLNDKLGKITAEVDESPKSVAILILAHGAGAGMNHPFMTELSRSISDSGITVVRFNFPYMEQGRKSPGSPKANIETWQIVLKYIRELFPGKPIFLSGKSYGGRMASHFLAESDDLEVDGIIYFGFPLHAPGKDSKDRADHLPDIKPPQLFLQGSKDKLANIELINEVVESIKNAEIKTIEDADHSFNVPKKSGKSKEEVMHFISQESLRWMKNQLA